MAWNAPVLHVTNDIISAADYNYRYYNERYLKGIDGPITLSDLLVGTAKALCNGGVGDHSHATAGAEGGQLDWDSVWADAVHSHLSDAEGGVLITTGTYTGNNATNRAIPHGLGTIPRQIFITATNTPSILFSIVPALGNLIQDVTQGVSTAVTSVTATNFYVGDVSDYVKTANDNGYTYGWIAFK